MDGENFVTLFTNDPNFINLKTFPPSGAIWNNILWPILGVAWGSFQAFVDWARTNANQGV